MNDKSYNVQQIGFGPSGIGVMAAADRVGQLQPLLNDGYVVHEQCARMNWSGRHLDYGIESNTPAHFFTDHFARDGIFSPIFDSSVAKQLLEAAERRCDLRLANKFLEAAVNIGELILARHATSAYLCPSFVQSVVVNKNGVTTKNEQSVNVRSQFLIACTGASEKIVAGGCGEIESTKVLRDIDAQWITDLVGSGGNIGILGRSHSAFSVAHVIEQLQKRKNRAGKVFIRTDSRPRLYFDTVESALASGYIIDDGDEITAEGAINLYSGLRGNAASVALGIALGSNDRCRLVPSLAKDLDERLIISAVGYQPNPLCMYTDNGSRIEIMRDKDRYVVDEKCRLIDRSGNVIPNAFGLGLGFYRKMGMNRFTSVNDFLGDAANEVLMQIMRISSEASND